MLLSAKNIFVKQFTSVVTVYMCFQVKYQLFPNLLMQVAKNAQEVTRTLKPAEQNWKENMRSPLEQKYIKGISR